MPRYSRGTDDAARHAPPIERRDAPPISRSAPVPPASQFSASATEGVDSYKASAGIGTVEGSILRTSGCRPASHLLARLEEKSWRTRLQFVQEISWPRKELDSRHVRPPDNVQHR